MELANRVIRVLVMGVVIGSLTSIAAIGFVEAIDILNDKLWISSASRSSLAAHSGTLLTLATIAIPTLGGLIVGLIVVRISDKRPHNPSDVLAAIQCNLAERSLKTKDSILSIIASTLSLGAGASVGQYGPIVHLGAFIGYRLPWLGKLDPKLCIGCGVASAIATLFNAPIAGVVLVHEIFLRHYSLRAFAPITVASSTGFYIANHIFQRKPLFEIAVAPLTYVLEFFAFVIVGIVGALLAVAFMRLLITFSSLARHTPVPQPVKPMLAGLVLGLVATQVPDVLGIGADTLDYALTPGGFTPQELAIILVAKLLMTALCIGFGFAGGVFSPALLLGVLYGALAGFGVDWLLPNEHSAIANYAIAGMAAFTSPVIGAPLATIIIVFELTRSYELATVVMVSVVFSNVVSYHLFGRSLFDYQLKYRGYDLDMGRAEMLLEHSTIKPLICDDFTRCDGETTLNRVRNSLSRNGHSDAHIVDPNGVYLGMVSLSDIVNLEENHDICLEKVSSHLKANALSFEATMSVKHAMEIMEDFVGESIPVVETDTGRFLGVVYESSLIKVYIQQVRDLRDEENSAA